MLHKTFKQLYSIDQISQNKSWAKVREALSQLDTDEDIQIDFTGINVSDPWNCNDFIEIIKNPKIHMIFKNKDELVNSIKMTCILNGANPDNIINIEVEKPVVETAEEKKIKQYGEGLVSLFFKDENTGAMTIDLGKKYTQLHNTSTISYLQYAINKIHSTAGKKHFIAIIGKTIVLDSVLDALALLIVRCKSQGITLEVDIDNPDVINKMGLYLHKATAKVYTKEEKEECIRKYIKGGMPGLLLRYKKTRGTDDFGRYGKGEVISCRIAIIRGLKSKGNENVVIVDSYNNDYFFTRQHWMIEHDNERLSRLQVDRLEISLDELGFTDKYLGSTYHFLEPVPYDDTDNCKIIVAIDENGKNVTKSCTLPERMKYVFDDWGIEYNNTVMEKYIAKTLSKQRNGGLSKNKMRMEDELDIFID